MNFVIFINYYISLDILPNEWGSGLTEISGAAANG